MNEGIIEIMNRKQVMFSPHIAYLLQNEENYARIKELTMEEYHEISNHLGAKRLNLVKNISDIFDLYGLGKLEIVEFDEENKNATLNLYNSSLAYSHVSKNSKATSSVCIIPRAILAGIFSYMFDSDCDCREVSCYGKGDEYCRFVIKKGEEFEKSI